VKKGQDGVIAGLEEEIKSINSKFIEHIKTLNDENITTLEDLKEKHREELKDLLTKVVESERKHIDELDRCNKDAQLRIDEMKTKNENKEIEDEKRLQDLRDSYHLEI